MIQLAAVQSGAVNWSEIAARLRDATLEATWDIAKDASPPTGVDAALFLTPGAISTNQVTRCLESNLHVLIVADAWLTKGSLAELESAAGKNGVQLAVVNPDRAAPSYRLIRQQLDSGNLGVPGLFRLHRWEPSNQELGSDPRILPPPLVRDLELACNFMGQRLERVFGVEQPSPGSASAAGRPCWVAHLGFSGGGMALLDYTDNLPAGDDYFSMSLIGSQGAAYADDHQNMQLVYGGGAPQSIRMDDRSCRFASLVQEFVHGIVAKEGFSSHTANWHDVLAIVDALQRSIESKRAIEIGQ